PGGAQGAMHKDWITRPEQVQETMDLTHTAFLERGLEAAWERVIAIVVQPGVEFGDQEVIDYHPDLSRSLSLFIESLDHLVYEAHSTDYQLPSGLRQLVADHFAILKVGPALTFALREAVFALAQIEEESLAGRSGTQLSQVRTILENAMQSNPKDWLKYYRGDPHEVAIARKYSYSDRIRYYWSTPTVRSALTQLLHNLETEPVPGSLISQYLPQQYWKMRNGELDRSPRAIIQDKIQEVLQDYAYACGYRAAPSTRLSSGRSR
ncbi:MAG TPA: class II D-tagatose-bisphosphate aldolase, non-catalytic subunit, partial [Anaerolineales bacterium]|nr:class II D-tagatose-bisphosphate aldolase, non-catalytic subunit [Anaerolineales bacterium]